MRKSRLWPGFLIAAGLTGLVAVTLWNFFQVRYAVGQENQRWVKRVSEMLGAERNSYNPWIDQFPADSRRLIASVVASNSFVDGVYLTDTRTHTTQRWVNPLVGDALDKLDPRLVVLELQTLESQKTEAGPLLFLKGIPHCTVVRPLDHHRALIAYIRARGVMSLLEDESRLWHLKCFVYDYERHPIFASSDPALLRGNVAWMIAKAHTGTVFGFVPLDKKWTWQWLATFHYDPTTDWIFVVAQPAPWAYMPFFSFLLATAAVILLASLPFRGKNELTRRQWYTALSQFAIRVDKFIRGKDVVLSEPPYPFKELMPIVAALRWLMPQWKKAEAYPQELGLERKLLALLVETLPEGILFFNAEGGLQLANELGRVFLALQQESGRESKMVSGVQVPRGFLEPFVEPVFTGVQANMGKEVEVGWADGKHLYRVWVERVDESEGRVDGFIVVVRDITFRKQWEYVQEQVLSGITHDLRGPLSAVMGYLDLIRRQLKEGPPKALEYVGLAREAGVRLTQMVSDILDVVRFEQGKIDLQPEAIGVSDIFQRLNHIFSVTAEQKKVNLKFSIEGPSGMKTWGDPKLLERIFDNLVGNAIKFTPGGGTIAVTAQQAAGKIIFQVADTGRGIPREAQSRIFDKFQQVRPGDRSAGYGLGLAVAKFIVEAHKGEIRVESEVGLGSRFTFWIPDQPASAAVSAVQVPSAEN